MSRSARTPKPRVIDLSGARWLAAPDAKDGPQVAFLDEFIVLRNGADPGSPVLIFNQDEWLAFQRGATRGEFNELG